MSHALYPRYDRVIYEYELTFHDYPDRAKENDDAPHMLDEAATVVADIERGVRQLEDSGGLFGLDSESSQLRNERVLVLT